jgi:hypothetical protein
VNIVEVAKQMGSIVHIQSSLMKQDELDKKGIFLMGTRENEQTQTKSQVSKN